jgi:hypothetical protein
MQSFKSKLRAIPHTLNEGRLSDITIKLKRVWTKLKRAITSLFQRALKKAEIGEEVSLSIPGQQNESKFENGEMIMEGPLQVIKGNYNEALVLQYIYNWDKPGVDIAPKYEKERRPIQANADKWGQDLKDLAKSNKSVDYKSSLKIIEQGSEDMTRYLVHTAVEEGATIIGGRLDNLSYLEGGIESKADIELALLKDGKVELEKHSLKIYSTKSVGLANTTAGGLALHLVGEKAKEKVIDEIKKDKKLSEMIEKAGLIDKVKQDHKAWLKDPKLEKTNTIGHEAKLAYNRLMTQRAPRIDGSDASKIKQIHDLDQKSLEAERKVLREPINKWVAEIVYNVIKPYANTEEFGENILKMLGLKDKETKMLMSVSTAKKSLILDKHPELDMANISLEWVGVSIKVVGPTGKTIVSFGVKEGEKKAVAGKVSFADVTPVDLANYPLFDA